MNNKREGPGSYFFNESKKVIVGEWVDDCPKSSIYAHVETNQHKNMLQLPNLMMDDLGSLLNQLFNKVKIERLFFRINNCPLSLISDEEMESLQSEWTKLEKEGYVMNLENFNEFLQNREIKID